MRLILLFALGMIWFMMPEMKAFAGDIYSPKRGTAERKHIMNAIRPLLEVRVGAPVEFVVDRLRIYQSWAFAVVNPQRPGGKAISPDSSTYHVSEFSDGLHSYVLLKYAYKRWNIVDYAIGPTDVFWIGDPLYEQFPPDFIN
ncbi:MAG: hypothetical protein OIF54_11790 [Cohaesibacter sp.]|nr:hypothetical protein [Cohaesibacter sp.]